MSDPSRLLAVVPDPASPELARTLDLAGYTWKAVNSTSAASDAEPDGGWAGIVIDATDDLDSAWSFLRTARKQHSVPTPALVLLSGGQLGELEHRDDLYDDFCLAPFHPSELEARLQHLQASIGGKPLDMTYMEYELLKFLVQNPGKVFTREILLSRVWGYEYYGGARTVDVHVRRLRAKLGEEHANLIHTVRSVGYRFGQSRWDS